LGHTEEHWHRGSMTEDQHSPVWPLRSVNKQLIFYLGVWEIQDQIYETSSAVKKKIHQFDHVYPLSTGLSLTHVITSSQLL